MHKLLSPFGVMRLEKHP